MTLDRPRSSLASPVSILMPGRKQRDWRAICSTWCARWDLQLPCLACKSPAVPGPLQSSRSDIDCRWWLSLACRMPGNFGRHLLQLDTNAFLGIVKAHTHHALCDRDCRFSLLRNGQPGRVTFYDAARMLRDRVGVKDWRRRWIAPHRDRTGCQCRGRGRSGGWKIGR